MGMDMKIALPLLVVIAGVFSSSAIAFATVIEFNGDGKETVYSAVDYLAGTRYGTAKSKGRDVSKKWTMRPMQYDAFVTNAAVQYGLPEVLIHAIILVESGYDTNAESRAGAVGLMQLMPETAKRFGVVNRKDAAQNINGGSAYLKWLLNRYQGDIEKTLAAYNAGEGAVDKYGGIPPYKEAREYVKKVSHILNGNQIVALVF